jgi:hypothetical protein
MNSPQGTQFIRTNREIPSPPGARSLEVCVDGAFFLGSIVEDDLWGIGIRWAFYDDPEALGNILLWGEEEISGRRETQRLSNGEAAITVDERENAGAYETFGLARAMWFIKDLIAPGVRIIIVTDRMSSVRALENHNGRDFKASKFSKQFVIAAKLFRVFLYQALHVHERIRFEYFKIRKYDEQWRADELARMYGHDKLLPIQCIDMDRTCSRTIFDFDADLDRKAWNDQMYAAQTVSIKTEPPPTMDNENEQMP